MLVGSGSGCAVFNPQPGQSLEQRLATVELDARRIASTAAATRLVAADEGEREDAAEDLREVARAVRSIAGDEQINLERVGAIVDQQLRRIEDDEASRIARVIWAVVRDDLGALARQQLAKIDAEDRRVIRRLVAGAVEGVLSATAPYVEASGDSGGEAG